MQFKISPSKYIHSFNEHNRTQRGTGIKYGIPLTSHVSRTSKYHRAMFGPRATDIRLICESCSRFLLIHISARASKRVSNYYRIIFQALHRLLCMCMHIQAFRSRNSMLQVRQIYLYSITRARPPRKEEYRIGIGISWLPCHLTI